MKKSKELEKFDFDRKDVLVPPTMKTVDTNDFCLSPKLRSITFSNGVKTIKGSSRFWHSKLEKIEFFGDIDKITADTFSYCKSLKTLIFHGKVREIGEDAFASCDNVVVTIPDGIEKLGSRAFNGAAKIILNKDTKDFCIENGLLMNADKTKIISVFGENVIVPPSITKLTMTTFNHCRIMKNLTFQGSIQLREELLKSENFYCDLDSLTFNGDNNIFGDKVFVGFNSVKSVIFNGSVNHIGYGAFGVKKISAKFFSDVGKIEQGAFMDAASVELNINNKNLCLENGLLMNAKKTKMISIVGHNVTIPSTIKKMIYFWCFGSEKIRTLKISSGIDEIQENAFQNCKNLRKVEFLGYTGKISQYAFEKCEKLTEVKFGGRVRELDKGAFWGCKSLQSINLPEGLEKIGHLAFAQCTSLKSVTLPEGLTTIRRSAFRECTSLESIIIPPTVKQIEARAFMDCTSLKSVSLPEGLEKIGSSAFAGCKSLENINLPKSVKSIGSEVFKDCPVRKKLSGQVRAVRSKMKSVSEMKKLLDEEFGGNWSKANKIAMDKLLKRLLPEKCLSCKENECVRFHCPHNSMNDYYAPDCKDLRKAVRDFDLLDMYEKKLAAGKKLEFIKEDGTPLKGKEIRYITNGCAEDIMDEIIREYEYLLRHLILKKNAEIRDIVVPVLDALRNVLGETPTSSDEFLPLPNLVIQPLVKNASLDFLSDYPIRRTIRSITFSDGVKTVTGKKCLEWSKLEKVEFMGDVEKIDDETFFGCDSLKSVIFHGKVKEIGEDAFAGCKNLVIELPSGIKKIGSRAFNGVAGILVNKNENNFCIENGLLMNAEKTKIISAFGGNISIPPQFSKLPTNTFNNCATMKNLVFEGKIHLEEIDPISQNYHCEIESFIFNGDDNYIGSNSFIGFDNIKSVIFNGSVKHIGYGAFCNFSGTVKFLSKVEEIKEHVFLGAKSIEFNGGCEKYCTENGLLMNAEKNKIISMFDKKIIIPPTVKETISFWIEGPGELETFVISKGVPDINNEAFRNCEKLKEVRIMGDIARIGTEAFEFCYKLSKVIFHGSVKEIDNSAFMRCKNLKKIILPKGLELIGHLAFALCESLKSVSLPEGLIAIRRGAFRECDSLEEIVIPSTVKIIEARAFEDCKSLKSVVLPEGLLKIGSSAFAGCKSLENINLPKSVKSIGCDVFARTPFNAKFKKRIQTLRSKMMPVGIMKLLLNKEIGANWDEANKIAMKKIIKHLDAEDCIYCKESFHISDCPKGHGSCLRVDCKDLVKAIRYFALLEMYEKSLPHHTENLEFKHGDGTPLSDAAIKMITTSRAEDFLDDIVRCYEYELRYVTFNDHPELRDAVIPVINAMRNVLGEIPTSSDRQDEESAKIESGVFKSKKYRQCKKDFKTGYPKLRAYFVKQSSIYYPETTWGGSVVCESFEAAEQYWINWQKQRKNLHIEMTGEYYIEEYMDKKILPFDGAVYGADGKIKYTVPTPMFQEFTKEELAAMSAEEYNARFNEEIEKMLRGY